MSGPRLPPAEPVPGPFQRLPAGLKLGLALALAIALVAVPIRAWPFFVAVAAVLLAVAVVARVRARAVLRRMILVEPVVVVLAALTLLQPGGWLVGLAIVVKSTLCLLTMLLLASTTAFPDVLRVLRALHLPALMVTTLALMYRYLFVLIDEGQRMRRARLSRTFDRRRRRTWRTLGTVIGQLFVRSTERAERIFAAMTARGWR